MQRGLGSCGLGVGLGEGGELEEHGGLDRVESRRMAIGFGRELPVVLEGVDLSEIDVGDGVVRIEAQRFLKLENGRIVVLFSGVVHAGVEMAEDVLGIQLDGTKDVRQGGIQVATIKVGCGDLTLNDVGVGRVRFGGGEQGVIVVEYRNAALGLDKIESEECDERGGESEAGGRGRKPGIQGEAGGGGEDGKAHGRNVEIALGEEVGGDGIEAESGGQSKDKPAKSEGEDRTGVTKIESREGHGEGAEESGDGPEGERFGHGEGVEIVHVDGDEEFADIAGKYGRNGEEEFPGRKGRTINIDSRRETAEGGDARNEIDGESDEKGSESRGDGANLGTRRAGVEKFVAEENDRKKESRFLTEESGQKEKDREKN